MNEEIVTEMARTGGWGFWILMGLFMCLSFSVGFYCGFWSGAGVRLGFFLRRREDKQAY